MILRIQKPFHSALEVIICPQDSLIVHELEYENNDGLSPSSKNIPLLPKIGMDPAVFAAVEEKFTAFNIHNITYQVVNGHSITVDVLIPRTVKPGKHPVIVSFHGGYLVCHPLHSWRRDRPVSDRRTQITGSSLFPGFLSPWIMDLAIQHSAVLLRPNYRKLPESTGLEILENLTEFWNWFHSGGLRTAITSATAGAVEADVSRTLVIGHSAGTCGPFSMLALSMIL